MPIIVESNPSNAELFTSVTGSSSEVVGSLEQLKQTLATSPDEFAIVLGPGVDLEASAALADMLRVTRPVHERHPDPSPGRHQRARRGPALGYARGRRGA